MVVEGRLSGAGISIPSEGSFLSCFQKRKTIIKYHDILSVERDVPGCTQVRYLCRSSKPYRVRRRTLRIRTSSDMDLEELADPTSESLLPSQEMPRNSTQSTNDEVDIVNRYIEQRAFAHHDLTKRNHTALVIINPHSGKNKAERLYNELAAPVFAACGFKTAVMVTKYAGEAKKVAHELDAKNFCCIICVSGDGLIHEVLNGLTSRSDSSDALNRLPLAQLPGGSGNALSLSLNHGETEWGALALGIAKGSGDLIDLMAITQKDTIYYSFLSQTFGIVAGCDVGTEHLRWMGPMRFRYGIVTRCLSKHKYPCKIEYVPGSAATDDEQADIVNPNLKPLKTINDEFDPNAVVEVHKNLSMFYVGKTKWMAGDALVFPLAKPLDGCMDMMVWDTDIGSINALRMLIKFETGAHVNHVPFYKKVSSYRLTPLNDEPHLSIDGEAYPPEPFQVDVIPRGARFITPNY